MPANKKNLGKKSKPGYRTPATFRSKVLAIVGNIPKGKTMTYGQIAKLAGSARAYRAVGNILSKNFDKQIPCHRVIRNDGNIGGYNRGSDNKKRKLQTEGWIAKKC